MVKDSQIIEFIKLRLIEVYGENPRVDYMTRLARIEANMREQEELWNKKRSI